ncbi:MAG: GNAT family N-acetyltransferase [Alteromonadaceae bacterium]|nr:GNAT family N-acetyltransferase [Alteromonadaceae bacterium]
MSAYNIVLKEQAPTVLEFASIRTSVGWLNPELPALQASMNASLYWVSAYLDGQIVGTGRVIGDGAMYYYVQDVIVHCNHQKRGLGSQIMQSINQYLTLNCQAGSTIGLFAAQGKENFYENFGFVSRDGQKLGLGMCRFLP